jgi:hypothetical protein
MTLPRALDLKNAFFGSERGMRYLSSKGPHMQSLDALLR